jgi:hypothetical protein
MPRNNGRVEHIITNLRLRQFENFRNLGWSSQRAVDSVILPEIRE